MLLLSSLAKSASSNNPKMTPLEHTLKMPNCTNLCQECAKNNKRQHSLQPSENVTDKSLSFIGYFKDKRRLLYGLKTARWKADWRGPGGNGATHTFWPHLTVQAPAFTYLMLTKTRLSRPPRATVSLPLPQELGTSFLKSFQYGLCEPKFLEVL